MNDSVEILKIGCQMTSQGNPFEVCARCERPIPRGDRMNGLLDSNGDGAGWWCDGCVRAAEAKP